MALVVRLIDIVDREKLETGTSFGVGDQGELQVWDAANRCIAMFAAGRWTGVIEIPSRQPVQPAEVFGDRFAKDLKDDDIHLHVKVDGKQMRKVAASETSKALDRLTDSISKQRG